MKIIIEPLDNGWTVSFESDHLGSGIASGSSGKIADVVARYMSAYDETERR